jgi:hypothetical protein
MAVGIFIAAFLVVSGATGHPMGMVVLAPVGLIVLILIMVRVSAFFALLLGIAALVLLVLSRTVVDTVPDDEPHAHQDRQRRFEDGERSRRRGSQPRLPEAVPSPVPAMGG